MAEDDPPPSQETPTLPAGYHEALVTAITVVIAFTLTFLLFWTVQSESGCWTGLGIASAVVLVAGATALFVALRRALSLNNVRPAHYEMTVNWFFRGVVGLALALVLAVAAMNISPRQQPSECTDSQQLGIERK